MIILKRYGICILIILLLPVGFVVVNAQPDILLSSQCVENPVTLDGGITNGDEWSEALPVDLQIGVNNGNDPPFLNTRIWTLNDNEWLYLLYRIEWSEVDYDPNDIGEIQYFWPEWDPVTGWDYSDGGWVSPVGLTYDVYGWDEVSWYLDVDATPPGENNVEGTGSHDGTYYWFEFRKKLNSGDGYDWNLEPCRVYGLRDGSDDVGGDLQVALWDGEEFYSNYVTLHIAECVHPIGGEILQFNVLTLMARWMVVGLVVLAIVFSVVKKTTSGIVRMHKKQTQKPSKRI